MDEEREVVIDDLRKNPKYKDSPLICNLILKKDMNPDDMKKNKASGSVHVIGLTEKEATKILERLHDLLVINV